MNKSTPGRCTPSRSGADRALTLLVLLVVLGLCSTATVAQQLKVPGCTFDIDSSSGHSDYRSQREKLYVVERRHFTDQVERLVSGESTSQPGPDINYTLNKFPNHHRALLALSRLGAKLSVARVPDMPASIDCYYRRALQFQPNDTVARMLYAQHLGRTKRAADGSRQLALTAKYANDNPLTHYNIGWVAFELQDYELALTHAQIAYAAGIDKPELRNLLKRAGKWTEPASPAAGAEPAASSAAPAADAASR